MCSHNIRNLIFRFSKSFSLIRWISEDTLMHCLMIEKIRAYFNKPQIEQQSICTVSLAINPQTQNHYSILKCTGLSILPPKITYHLNSDCPIEEKATWIIRPVTTSSWALKLPSGHSSSASTSRRGCEASHTERLQLGRDVVYESGGD